MENRFASVNDGMERVQNGGMFNQQQINRLTQQIIDMYGKDNELLPVGLARCMMDTYRGMNKHFIPTRYELSSFAKVFDPKIRDKISADDIHTTATRMFLANNQSLR